MLLLLTFFLIYFSPYLIINRIIFLLLLIPIYKSKKDYLWIAWLFILFDAPGYLFKGGLLNDPHRIPIYPIISSISITFYDLAILVLLIKAILKKNNSYHRFIFKKDMIFFIGLIIFYSVFSMLTFPFDIFSFYRTIIPWTFIYICFKLLDTEQKVLNFNKLLFPIVFIVLILTIYYLFTGSHFVNHFKGDYRIKSNLEEGQDIERLKYAARSLFSVTIVFYSLIMALVYYRRKNSIFPKYYLIIIVSSCFFSCFLTATRGYLLAVSFIILLSFLSNISNLIKLFETIVITLVIIAIFYIIMNANPVIRRQYILAIERYNTIGLLFEGDITAGGTVQRLDIRGPKVMSYVKESPLFGYGFSKPYYINADGDVGFFTVLLNVGYVGFVLIYIIFFGIIYKIFRFSSMKTYKTYFNNSGYVFIIGLLGIHIYHLTTNILFGLSPSAEASYPEKYLIYALLFSNFNHTINIVNIKYRKPVVAKNPE